MESFSYWMGMAGITAFAVTAVLVLAPRGIDLFSAIVLGIITAVGGGTLRDLILDVPVFWSVDLNYLWVAIAASLVTFYADALLTRKEIFRLMLYVDGLGAALFAIQTVDKSWGMDFGRPLAPIILGIVTAIGGGLLRDVLAGRQTLLMTRELYATPVLIGCTLYVALLAWVPDYRSVGAHGCVAVIFALRAAAIRWDLTMPHWLMTKPKAG
ncbi:MAG: trimeric intracellular cation channel family protein [Thiohalocapsa sp.]